MINLILFGSFFVMLLLNIPIAVSLGMSSIFALLFSSSPLTVVPTNVYSGMAKFLLLAIPFFVPVSYTHLDVYKRQLADRFYALEVRDRTRMAEDLWRRAEEMCIRDRASPSSCPWAGRRGSQAPRPAA